MAQKAKLTQVRTDSVTGHCGFTFDDDIWNKAGPNVMVSSRVHVFKLRNDN